jgi:hypothetical protein
MCKKILNIPKNERFFRRLAVFVIALSAIDVLFITFPGNYDILLISVMLVILSKASNFSSKYFFVLTATFFTAMTLFYLLKQSNLAEKSAISLFVFLLYRAFVIHCAFNKDLGKNSK